MANFPGVVSDLSLNDVKKAIQHLKDNNNWHPKSNDASTALEIAYIKKKYDVIDILVQEGFTLTMMNLPGVVMCQSVHYVNKAIQHLKYTNMWDSKCDCAAAALEVAYKLDMNDAFGLLSQDGVTLKISCLPDLVLSESFESVTKLIQLLKETNNWNPKCEDASRALENAYIKQKYSVCDLLVMEGVALTMKNFPTVVDHMSWKTTEKAMEHLKQNNAWDPKSDHAEKALEIALSKQNYDVFDLLVEKGVTLAMKNIPGVVGCVSLLSAQKAVQLLKCNSNWDSKCNDASKALEIGWKYTYLLDLLVTNGVTLTMKCLPLIVFHVSWESANKAIQHLKDNKNWNFNSEYASEALEAAYTKQKYNMIDVLVQEGVKLTMKNISRIVDIAQLTLIQKAVQHLKDSNSWDPKCDHASHSLQISLRKHKYTVFDLLVHEGVVLTMKHFPGVVESNSMMSVKKAIQYLKDTDKWDPNCADAIRALEIAWKHKCNLYDLLVQEEEILPMQDLPGVIDTVSYKDVDQHVRFIYSIMKPQ
ncbi:hypothetical protein ACJMK2_002920 [Sinanodonta woodiana]|uniref:Uncharacterized protein n=1 Tax=Sinanodonta woodiana TaxID=1069815 RepID=A0ABD3XWN8_SINWO